MEPQDDVEQRESRPMGIRGRIAYLLYRLQAMSVAGYMGAASLIGIEALAIVIGFTTVLPIAIPFVVLILGGAYFFRERLRTFWARLRALFART